MIDTELETKTRRRAHEIWASEGHPVGAADRHWLAAEREVADEVHSAAVCRWTAPVKGSYVEASTEAAELAAAGTTGGARRRAEIGPPLPSRRAPRGEGALP